MENGTEEVRREKERSFSCSIVTWRIKEESDM